MKNRIKFVEQTEHSECGLACAVMVLNSVGVNITLNEVRDTFGVPRGGVSLYNLAQIFENYGIACKAYEVSNTNSLQTIGKPFICLWEGNHYVVVKNIRKKTVTIMDPAIGKRKLTRSEFDLSFSRYILVIDRIKILHNQEKIKNVLSEKIRLFIWNNKIKLLVLFGIMILIQLNNLVMPMLMQQFIDNGKIISIFANLPVVLLFIFFIFGYTFIIENIKGNIISKIQFEFSKDLTSIFIKKIVGLDFKYFINRTSGDWIYRARLVEYIQQLLTPELMFSIVDMIFALIYFGIMLHYNLRLTIVVLLTSIFFVCTSVLNTKMMFNMNAKELILQSKVQKVVVEFFEGIETIKSLKMEEEFGKKWKEAFLEQQVVNYKRNKMGNIFNSVTSGGGVIYPLIIGILGFNMINSGELSMGVLVAFISLAQLFLQPLLNILTTITQYILLKLYLVRINEIISIKECEKGLQRNTINYISEISVKNVYYRYSSFEPDVLKDISFNLKLNQKVAIVGLNGSGKSTLLKCLAGLLQPTKGKIYINGIDIGQIDSNDLRDKMCYINQQPLIFDATLRENIILNNSNYDEEDLEEILKITMVDKLIDEMPAGLDTHISQDGMNLSGGQKQKIALARALLKKPQIILMDEPTSSMDNISEKYIFDCIKKLNIICIVISHRLSTIMNFDKIIVIDNGEIKEEGNHEKLLDNKQLYSKIYAGKDNSLLEIMK